MSRGYEPVLRPVSGVVFSLVVGLCCTEAGSAEDLHMGMTVGQWIEQLRHGQSGGVRSTAARALGKIAGKRKHTSGFSDSPAREEDAAPVRELGDAQTRIVVSVLTAALADEDEYVRGHVAEALGHIGSAAKTSVPFLAEALHDKEASVRASAATALERIGQGARAAIPILIEKLKDSSNWVRVSVVMALDRIARDSRAVVPSLVDALGDPDSRVRRRAALALASKGKAVVPALTEALKADNPEARASAAYAFSNVGPEANDAWPVLVAAMKEDNPRVLARVLQALEAIGPAGATAVQPLAGNLKHEDSTVRKLAAEALGGLGAEGKAAAGALAGALKDREESVRLAAADALKKTGIDDETARALAHLHLPREAGAPSVVLEVLFDHPGDALAFLKNHPWALTGADSEALTDLLSRQAPSYRALQEAIRESENLSAYDMVLMGDARFLPKIRKKMQEADPYARTFLKACARALGEEPEQVVTISETEKGSFRPRSAWPNVDTSRRAAGGTGGHGDGLTTVLITGRILMSDGSPAVDPRFYRTNDRWLLGQRKKERVPIKYDPNTGRFFFLVRIFAAYSFSPDGGPRAPYQTGSAKMLIEARGSEPLEAQFFDEMPEVEIRLRSTRGSSGNSSRENAPPKEATGDD